MLQFWDQTTFYIKLHTTLHETSPYLQNLDDIFTKSRVLIPRKFQKNHQKYPL